MTGGDAARRWSGEPSRAESNEKEQPMNETRAVRGPRRTILLSIETKAREFPGKVLLACFLAERGFRVVLTNNRSPKEAVKHLAWLYDDRNTFHNRLKFFKNLKRLRVKIACLDEEGMVFANPDIYLKRLDPVSMRMTDLFLTWGVGRRPWCGRSAGTLPWRRPAIHGWICFVRSCGRYTRTAPTR